MVFTLLNCLSLDEKNQRKFWRDDKTNPCKIQYAGLSPTSVWYRS